MEKLTYNEFKEAIKDYFSKRMDHAEIQFTTNDTVNQKIDYHDQRKTPVDDVACGM